MTVILDIMFPLPAKGVAAHNDIKQKSNRCCTIQQCDRWIKIPQLHKYTCINRNSHIFVLLRLLITMIMKQLLILKWFKTNLTIVILYMNVWFKSHS